MFKRLIKIWEYGSGRTILAAYCAHSVSISIGICQGYSAILIPQLASSHKYLLTTEETSWIASLGAITNPIGSILSGVMADYFGRRKAIQFTSIPFLVGWLCVANANDINAIYAGRLITGIAAGMASASFTYVSEISTPDHRGFLQALAPINASFGILLTYILGYYIDWSIIALISLGFSIATLISMQFLPESPAYLIAKNQCQKSFHAYYWFRRSNFKAQEEVEKNGCSEKKSENERSLKDIYLSAETIKPFFLLIVLFLLQELSGIYTILFYTVNFFEKADLNMDEYISCIIVGFIRFAMSILTAILINKFGRKTLCVTSSIGMCLTILPLVIYSKYYEMFPSQEKILTFLPLFSIIFNVLFSMLGILPIPYILVGEYFPLKVRSIMSGVIICIAQCFIFICVKVYPYLVDMLSFSGTLLTFLVASFVSIIFCKYMLIETKDKSLKEIEESFKTKQNYCQKKQSEKEIGDKYVQGIFTIKINI